MSLKEIVALPLKGIHKFTQAIFVGIFLGVTVAGLFALLMALLALLVAVLAGGTVWVIMVFLHVQILRGMERLVQVFDPPYRNKSYFGFSTSKRAQTFTSKVH